MIMSRRKFKAEQKKAASRPEKLREPDSVQAHDGELSHKVELAISESGVGLENQLDEFSYTKVQNVLRRRRAENAIANIFRPIVFFDLHSGLHRRGICRGFVDSNAVSRRTSNSSARRR